MTWQPQDNVSWWMPKELKPPETFSYIAPCVPEKDEDVKLTTVISIRRCGNIVQVRLYCGCIFALREWCWAIGLTLYPCVHTQLSKSILPHWRH